MGIFATISIARNKLQQRQKQHDEEVAQLYRQLKGKADKQRAVIKGQLAEQIYPISTNCPYHLSDMRFMGMPIDYIIFDGYTETKDGDGFIRKIIFADVKTGSARLSPHQRSIRDAVESGRVEWQTIQL
jgi:predicted Holliday junction resolvase-like endonuclease